VLNVHAEMSVRFGLTSDPGAASKET
jgi:hypothetical protein